MTLKVRNSSSSWDTVNEVRVRNATGWDRVKTIKVRNATGWDEGHRSKFTFHYKTNGGIGGGPTYNKADISAILGDDDNFFDIEIFIDDGVTIYSDDVDTPALKTGTGSSDTSAIFTIINNGNIYGAGGTGGDGGDATGYSDMEGLTFDGDDGQDGGDALYLETDIILTNNGTIEGGGGGGAGGGGASYNPSANTDAGSGGGGGGGGQSGYILSIGTGGAGGAVTGSLIIP